MSTAVQAGPASAGQRYLASLTRAQDAARSCLCAPFDAIRSQHAGAVQAGFAPRSLLASAHFERSLDRLEKLCLGPLARRR
jgi:hypothetical protein